MHYKFSPSAGCFYPSDVPYADIPADAFNVTDKDFADAMGRPDGHTFTFINRQLVITPPAPVPFAASASGFLSEVRSTREAILNRLAGIGMAALVDGESGIAAAIAQARRELLEITEAPEVLAAIGAENMPALEDAVKARYKAIAAGVPLEVRNAFNKVSL